MRTVIESLGAIDVTICSHAALAVLAAAEFGAPPGAPPGGPLGKRPFLAVGAAFFRRAVPAPVMGFGVAGLAKSLAARSRSANALAANG